MLSLKHCWRPWTQGDWDLAEKMLTAWTNFAKYSDPNGEDGQSLGWTPYTVEKPQFMLFKLDDKDAEASEMGESRFYHKKNGRELPFNFKKLQ